jgi:predicted RNA-binding protein YlxR (DUF448 family)
MAQGPRRVEPVRSCVVCRSSAAKHSLYRIVRSPAGGVSYDPTGKAPGRGAYLCGQAACLEAAGKRRRLQRALKAADAGEVGAAVEALRAALASRPPGSGRPADGNDDGNNKNPNLVGASHVSELEEVRTG